LCVCMNPDSVGCVNSVCLQSCVPRKNFVHFAGEGEEGTQRWKMGFNSFAPLAAAPFIHFSNRRGGGPNLLVFSVELCGSYYIMLVLVRNAPY
jgi:hypothetical protein